MILRRVALAEVPGGLWLAAMPGRDAPLAEFFSASADQRIGHVMCLAGGEELARKSPDYAARLAAGDLPWRWRACPIEDFSVPADPAAFAAAIAAAAALLRQGERLVLHCAAGIGRTGLAAICLLRELGLDQAEAEARIRAAGSGPETEEQRAFVRGFSGAAGSA